MKPGPKPFFSKICPACGINKPRSDYYKKGSTVSYKCKPCKRIEDKIIGPRYFGKYRVYQNAWRKRRYQSDPEYRERIAAQKKACYDKRKDKLNEARRQRWAIDPNHPEKLNPRRGGVGIRTPQWADTKAISAFYVACPEDMEVDHVIPLKGLIDGRPVSGLHVRWNLQYLTPTANRRKKNRISEKDLA